MGLLSPTGSMAGVFSIDVRVTVRLVDVEMFELRRGGKQNVRIVRRVRLKMFQNDRKQIFASEASQNALLIRRNCCRIAVVNNEGSNRRIRIRQGFAEPAHVDRSRACPDQIRSLDAGIFQSEEAARLNSAPPPGWRHAPTRAGRQKMFRTAMPPPAWRWRP